MKRREFITLLGGATVWPLAAFAQQTDRVRRVGILLSVAPGDAEFQRRIATIKKALQEFGWVEGRTIDFATRYAEGKPERLTALASELVQAKVDVIVTQGGESIDAARRASDTVPIVMASVGDAVGQGIVASLSHPGGNVTGLSLFATEQGTKRLELLKEIYPSLARIAVFWNGNSVGHRLQENEMEQAVPVLGLTLHSVGIRTVNDIDEGFGSAKRAGVQAIVTMEDPFIQFHRSRIVDLAMRQKLPVVGEFRPIVVAGGLMSYGPNQIDMWRRAATYVDKIFKGARASDLPVELPVKFELVINLKTAKTLGLTVPPSLLSRADELIE